jgi:hypothetical protein
MCYAGFLAQSIFVLLSIASCRPGIFAIRVSAADSSSGSAGGGQSLLAPAPSSKARSAQLDCFARPLSAPCPSLALAVSHFCADSHESFVSSGLAVDFVLPAGARVTRPLQPLTAPANFVSAAAALSGSDSVLDSDLVDFDCSAASALARPCVSIAGASAAAPNSLLTPSGSPVAFVGVRLRNSRGQPALRVSGARLLLRRCVVANCSAEKGAAVFAEQRAAVEIDSSEVGAMGPAAPLAVCADVCSDYCLIPLFSFPCVQIAYNSASVAGGAIHLLNR